MSDSTFQADLFIHLTPERVLDAVETGGLTPTGLCYPLNSFENRVYEVELEDKSRVVAKFYRPGRWSREQILEEHQLVQALDHAEIPVCTVQPFPDGETLKTIDRVYYALSPRRGGRAPDELTTMDAQRLGMWLGRMHSVASALPIQHRPSLNADRYVRQALVWIDAWKEDGGDFPYPLHQRYTDATQRLAEIADQRLDGITTQLIHADLHLGNVLFRDQELRVLDFDDMAIGPPVQDIWLVLPGRDEEALQLRSALLEGYEQFRDFNRSTLDLIELLRAMRMVRYAGWLAHRWHDPAFKSSWPHFGSEEYWRQETEDLEEQLALVVAKRASEWSGNPAGSTSQVPVSEADEMTNKDFFWDWEDPTESATKHEEE